MSSKAHILVCVWDGRRDTINREREYEFYRMVVNESGNGDKNCRERVFTFFYDVFRKDLIENLTYEQRP